MLSFCLPCRSLNIWLTLTSGPCVSHWTVTPIFTTKYCTHTAVQTWVTGAWIEADCNNITLIKRVWCTRCLRKNAILLYFLTNMRRNLLCMNLSFCYKLTAYFEVGIHNFLIIVFYILYGTIAKTVQFQVWELFVDLFAHAQTASMYWMGFVFLRYFVIIIIGELVNECGKYHCFNDILN